VEGYFTGDPAVADFDIKSDGDKGGYRDTNP